MPLIGFYCLLRVHVNGRLWCKHADTQGLIDPREEVGVAAGKPALKAARAYQFRLEMSGCWGMQVAKKELAMAIALSGKRFPEGSASGDRRHSAEKEYAEAMARIGGSLNDAAIMAMAAEAFMNLSPWDYYEVSSPIPLTLSNARCLKCAQIYV